MRRTTTATAITIGVLSDESSTITDVTLSPLVSTSTRSPLSMIGSVIVGLIGFGVGVGVGVGEGVGVGVGTTITSVSSSGSLGSIF